MSTLSGKRLVHLTTTDITLALLLGPQLRAFAAAGMEVIGVSAPGPFVEQIERQGIRHVPLRHATRSVSPVDDLLALPELVSLFRRLRPDIVHTHNPKPGLYGRLAAKAAGVPAIVNTVHGLYATPEDGLVRKTVVYTLERTAASCSGAELVQNPDDLETLRRLRVPDARLTLLGNGVDLTRFEPRISAADVARAREELGVAPSAVVAGTVGRLVWQKGFVELFAAARQVRDTHPDVVFVVVGPEDVAKSDALGEADLAAARDRQRDLHRTPRRRRVALSRIRPLRAPLLPGGLPALGDGGGRVRSPGRRDGHPGVSRGGRPRCQRSPRAAARPRRAGGGRRRVGGRPGTAGSDGCRRGRRPRPSSTSVT